MIIPLLVVITTLLLLILQKLHHIEQRIQAKEEDAAS
jgi:competence protein ComGC